jgi:voltage-gated potassium channel
MTSPEPSPTDGATAASGSRRTPLGRAKARFVTDPASTRNAIFLIVAVDLTIVLIGGTIIWFFDRQEYEHLTTAFWYTLQTITTVGYGDVTPTEPVGRLVGAAIMVLGLAFLSILTATITSSFIDARQVTRRAEQADDDDAERARLDARLDALNDRFDRLEELIRANRGADS